MLTPSFYRGYRYHRNKEADRKNCDEFIRQFKSDIKFTFEDVLDGKYHFVTSMRVPEAVQTKMVSTFGAKFEDSTPLLGADGKFHVFIDAAKEWVNPLLLFDLFFLCPLLCAWATLGLLSLYNLYFLLFR